MSDWEKRYEHYYQQAMQPRTRYLTTDPRIAVALAYDDGLRTQSCTNLYEIGKESKKSRTVRAIESRSKGAGTGADVNAEYHKIRRYVDSLLDTDPLHYVVIMTLSPVKEAVREACKGEVYDMLHDRVRMQLAERGERILKKRAERLIALSKAMVEQTMRAAEWRPKHIAAWCGEWCGVEFDHNSWNKLCLDDWQLLSFALCDIKDDALKPISTIIAKINSKLAA